ncbi:hypothetical protein [Smaragdicoccus niigatensis]|nr:hypothetical protein [Smaragdicoccus niigatensis]
MPNDGPPLHFQHSCGAEYHPVLACKACGQVIRPGEVNVVDAPSGHLS